MKWTIQYRTKGDNNIKTEIVDVHFDKKNDVKKWWLSKTAGYGYRQDNEWLNCKKMD